MDTSNRALPLMSTDPTAPRIAAGALHLAPQWTVVDDVTGTGVFLNMPAPAEPACHAECALGRIAGLARFTSFHRFSPFWTRPAVGRDESQVRPETLWLLAQTSAGSYTMVVPLLDSTTRYSLRGAAAGLVVVAETGDPAVVTPGGVALFVACGNDPYALVEAGARAVQRQLGMGRLRVDKPQPDFIDHFGWCTWDAFYKEVTPEKVFAGLDAFAAAGVPPRLLILDDGWQTWQRAETGEDRLTSLAPNERFGGDLTPLVRAVKANYGVQRVMVWHALLGYWGGLSEAALPGYGTRSVARSFGAGILEHEPRWNVLPWGAQVGVPAADKFAQFYDDLHTPLARQGVDGVKVDVQGMLEGVSAGQGGRMAVGLAARRALEASTRKHFDGRLINCMSSTSECVYLGADSNLVRSSDDFFPTRPESHGLHLHVNAMASLWFGEFMQPDWDMFQSTHERGAFHAAARAVSGGPVYVSDKPGLHDAELLRKLVLADGSVLRADRPGRPSPDSLFADPTREPVLLKIFNRNRDGGVVGLFNARHGSSSPAEGTVGRGDVPGLGAAPHVAWAHQRDALWLCADDAATPITLAEGEWELVSFAPVEHGFAAIGLADKFNSAGAITQRQWADGACHLVLRDGGRFLGWCERAPHALQCDGAPLPFSHDATTGRLQAEIPTGGPRSLLMQWPRPA